MSLIVALCRISHFCLIICSRVVYNADSMDGFASTDSLSPRPLACQCTPWFAGKRNTRSGNESLGTTPICSESRNLLL